MRQYAKGRRHIRGNFYIHTSIQDIAGKCMAETQILCFTCTSRKFRWYRQNQVVYAPMSRYLPYSNRIQIGRSSENKTGTAQLTFAAHRMERTANTHFQHQTAAVSKLPAKRNGTKLFHVARFSQGDKAQMPLRSTIQANASIDCPSNDLVTRKP